MLWYWHCKIKHWAALALLIITIILAMIIIIAEFSIFIPIMQKANPIYLSLSS